jgi:nicotinate-nucleotide adenylyltransferase
MEDSLRIGIYGGTFSPPHNGHIKAAKAFVEYMRLDLLYVVPAFQSPNKPLCGEVCSAQRFRMCELAFGNIDGVIVSDIEIKRNVKSYTVETLRELSGEDRKLFLLLGTDKMLTLDKWFCSNEIFERCYPVYIRRESDCENNALIIEKNNLYLEKFGKIVRRIPCDALEISSSKIRDAIKKGDDISKFVPKEIEAYIKENNLYKN